MHGLLLAAISPDNTPHGYNLTFLIPEIGFIVVAAALYLRFRRPHRVPGRAELALTRPAAAQSPGRAPAGAARPGQAGPGGTDRAGRDAPGSANLSGQQEPGGTDASGQQEPGGTDASGQPRIAADPEDSG